MPSRILVHPSKASPRRCTPDLPRDTRDTIDHGQQHIVGARIEKGTLEQDQVGRVAWVQRRLGEAEALRARSFQSRRRAGRRQPARTCAPRVARRANPPLRLGGNRFRSKRRRLPPADRRWQSGRTGTGWRSGTRPAPRLLDGSGRPQGCRFPRNARRPAASLRSPRSSNCSISRADASSTPSATCMHSGPSSGAANCFDLPSESALATGATLIGKPRSKSRSHGSW